MKPTFFKGVVLGSVVSLATLMGATAFAGTGVGGVFNLGQNNTVNGTTKLTGATAAGQLDVVNNSTGTGATGIGITVKSGKPPLVVNSATKVSNLNADLLDGSDSTAFQKRVAGQCANRTAISAVNADGTVSCDGSAVYPIYHDLGFSSSTATDTFGSSGLTLDTQCLAPSAVGVGFTNAGANSSTVNWMYSTAGSASTVNVGGIDIPDGQGSSFSTASTGLAGQFIWTTTTGQFPIITRYVVTINLHEVNSGTECVFTGTAEVATSVSRL